MKLMLQRLVPVAVLSLTTLPAAAHHSQAIYDTNQVITIEGVVTDYRWTNPHTYLYIETRNDAGETIVQPIEGQVTAIMRRLGFSRDTFAPGDRVTARAHPSRDPNRLMALISSVEKDGIVYSADVEPLRSLGTASGRTDSVAGIWEVPFGPLIRQFSEPSSWALTERGTEFASVYSDRDMNPQLQCMPRTAPWLMIFTGVHKIELGENVVSIRTEYNTVDRVVHMNASHEGAVVTRQGHSIGWWDDDVLVVDTTHFEDNRSGHARGIRSGPQKHLIERFSLNSDGRSLTYRFELEDPEYLAQPVTGELQAAYRPDLDFQPVQCDIDTAGRFNSDSQ